MGLVCRVCARVNGRDRVDAEERADRQNKNVVVFHVRFFIGLVKRRRAKGARRRDVGNQIARVRRFESSPSLISRQSTSRLKLTALGDLHRARRRTGLRPDGFDRLDDVHALAHGAEHDVLPVQPARRRRAQEELRPVRARSSVRHGQNSRTGVLELKVFILKLVPVDGFTPRAVVVGEVAALAHESGMTRWKLDPSYPKPFSPVHSARKFSTRIASSRVSPSVSPSHRDRVESRRVNPRSIIQSSNHRGTHPPSWARRPREAAIPSHTPRIVSLLSLSLVNPRARVHHRASSTHPSIGVDAPSSRFVPPVARRSRRRSSTLG